MLVSMPELPEVETTRRHIAEAVVGRTITGVDVHRERMTRRNHRAEDLGDRLIGRKVVDVGRRGKFIVIEMIGDLWCVIHLGMSGRIRIVDGEEALEPHANVVIEIDNSTHVRMIDPRTFGFVAAWTPQELATNLASIGPDALDSPPSVAEVQAALRGRTAPIKAVLLDQRLMAGLGNIYADEVLIRSRIHPRRPAGSLSFDEISGLMAAVTPVLRAGIQHGGTSLDDLAYLLPDGRAGEFLSRLYAYGRTGERCPQCGDLIERTVVAQRSSHFCPSCQPLDPTIARPGIVT